jgi:hypothetical protein
MADRAGRTDKAREQRERDKAEMPAMQIAVSSA